MPQILVKSIINIAYLLKIDTIECCKNAKNTLYNW